MAFVLAGCAHEPAPVAPGPPLRAEADLVVDTMDAECDGLVHALEHYRDCTYMTARQRDGITSSIEATQLVIAAGRKATPDARSQHAIAVSCRRAAVSIKFGTDRCNSGPPPRTD